MLQAEVVDARDVAELHMRDVAHIARLHHILTLYHNFPFGLCMPDLISCKLGRQPAPLHVRQIVVGRTEHSQIGVGIIAREGVFLNVVYHV